jgi:hypothetical protein
VSDQDQESKNRIARNEAIFREVNERVDELKDEQAPMRDFLCECGNLDCVEAISMTDDEYEGVRAKSTTFAVTPGHVLRDVESVVEETTRFVVVEKHAEQSAIAEATDPRD